MTRRGESIVLGDGLVWHYDPPRWWNLHYRGGTWTMLNIAILEERNVNQRQRILSKHLEMQKKISEYGGEHVHKDFGNCGKWLLPQPQYGLTFSYMFKTYEGAMRFRLIEI